MEQDLKLEQVVIGSILIDAAYCASALEMLDAECFIAPKHREIYNAIMYLSAQDLSIDLLSVVDRLQVTDKLTQSGGVGYISGLATSVGAAIHVDTHALLLLQNKLRRNLYVFADNLKRKTEGKTGDIATILEETERQFLEIIAKRSRRKVRSSADVFRETLTYLEARHQSGQRNGVLSGFESVDAVTNGWQRGNLIVLAARPSMGKTALALNFASNAVFESNLRVLFFSLEMTSKELMMRVLSSLTRIPSQKLQHQTLSASEWLRLDELQSTITNANIYIDDTPALSLSELRSKARQLSMKSRVDMIVVDYLQLMHVSKAYSREQEVSLISGGLKQLAKELDVPVIALSQLSRAVTGRLDKRPMLSDLRDSGAIEQDADIVLFVHRPEYYGITADSSGNSTEGVTELIFAKNRNGAVQDVELTFVPEIVSFEDKTDKTVPF